MYKEIVEYIKKLYNSESFIPLHVPQFDNIEKEYLNDCIDSTFVSSVGKYVNEVEENLASFCGTKRAIAVTNGTAALHLALHVIDTNSTCEVITQPLTFVATANAIRYTGADPIFLDVDKETLGLSPLALSNFLANNAEIRSGKCFNSKTGKLIKACIPMHTFGFPCHIQEIKAICDEWHIDLIEDAAESLGSYIDGKHTGTFGKCATLSFNGNKIITAGGGGAIVTDDDFLADQLKHLSTTAKTPHQWEYSHDRLGYNYRMPNLNAALLMGQMKKLSSYITSKRKLASLYEEFFSQLDVNFITERKRCQANYWLNTVEFNSLNERNEFLQYSNQNGVMTRPVWNLLNELPEFLSCQTDDLTNAKILSNTLVNLPSTPNLNLS